MMFRHACLGLLILMSSIGVAQAQGRIIEGNVREEFTKEPIVGATVQVDGTTIGTITELEGSFVLTGVPEEPIALRINAPNYREAVVQVDATQRTLSVELQLARSEEIVIIGRAPQITRQNLANGASVVKGNDVVKVSSQTLESALQGRISGANIQSNSGAPGGGAQIKLRGVSTINGESSPLFVIDGVMISNDSIPSGIAGVTGGLRGGQENATNRIADIDLNDIENIEVLKGPAAAALYGSKATNGVIIITTKQGRAGQTRASVRQRLGVYQRSNKLGARVFESLEEAVETFGPLAAEYYREGEVFNHEDMLTNSVGLASETAASMSGGTEATRYYTSLTARRDPGIIDNTGYDKQSMRLNLSHDFNGRLKVASMANLIRSSARRSVTNNDNTGISHYVTLASTPTFIDLRPYEDGTYPANPFIGSNNNPLQTAALMRNREDVWRLIGATSANWKLWKTETRSINLGANLGIDRFQQGNTLLFPPELTFIPPDRAEGIYVAGSAEVRNFNFGINMVYELTPVSNTFQTATTIGLQYDNRTVDIISVQARDLIAGQPSLGAGLRSEAFESHAKVLDQGLHIQQEGRLLDGRLTLLGALLAERSSANGDTGDLYFYPKAAATYRFPVEHFDLVRTRLAYGETGNKPPYGYKFTPLDATQVVEDEGGIVGSGIAGDSNIQPERQRELEVGLDAAGLGDRAVLEATIYQRSIDDLILERRVPPSMGYSIERLNAGAMRNRGIELMLQVTPVQDERVSWVSRTILSVNRSTITELNVPAFYPLDLATGLGAFRIEEGKSATQLVGNVVDEAGNVVVKKIGDTEPTFRMSFSNTVTFGSFEFSSLLDWQQGGNIMNITKVVYDLAGNSPDFVDAGLNRLARWNGGADATAYLESASFLKVRELSLSYKLPEPLAQRLGPVSTATVSLSGRNLLTFTPYTGLDPEVSNFGNQTIVRNLDVAPFPPSRSFWLSLDVGF